MFVTAKEKTALFVQIRLDSESSSICSKGICSARLHPVLDSTVWPLVHQVARP